MIIQFNWYEIQSVSMLADTSLTLFFCLFINEAYPVQKRIASSPEALKYKLRIKQFPTALLSRNLIVQTHYGLFSNYKCAEPQSWVSNCRFVHADVPAIDKANYLHILSQRRIHELKNWIPKQYVDKKHWTNPFVTLQDDKLIFKLEKNYDNINYRPGLVATKKTAIWR